MPEEEETVAVEEAMEWLCWQRRGRRGIVCVEAVSGWLCLQYVTVLCDDDMRIP